jgi:hypothetical protein
MQIDISAIPGATRVQDGLPRPDWNMVSEWVQAHVQVERLDAVWKQLTRQWVEMIRAALPDRYQVIESGDFLVLSSLTTDSERMLVRDLHYARHEILSTLPEVALDEGHGHIVVLAFDDLDTYYDYTHHFYPEDGEFGGSGGMHIGEGYSHIAICTQPQESIPSIVAHEMTHALLIHLPLPCWLDEGVTQVLEEQIAGVATFWMDRELRARHQAYWDENTIQTFWTGEAFLLPDDGQELSYNLAQVLVRNLMTDFPHKFTTFLNTAEDADAGDRALLAICNTTLSKRVAQFLGTGDWSPSLESDPDRDRADGGYRGNYPRQTKVSCRPPESLRLLGTQSLFPGLFPARPCQILRRPSTRIRVQG